MDRTRALAAAALAAAGWACATKAGGAQVERKVVEWAKASGFDLAQVRCPPSIAVAVGATFDCTGALPGGDVVTVRGTITSKSGSNFEYALALVDKLYSDEVLVEYLAGALLQRTGTKPAAVACGPGGYHKLPADLTIRCTATDPQGITTPIAVTVDADASVVGWAAQ